ncbi:LOW QUALITY PROTEIN: granzyme M [Callospermophilus lateralis]
MASLQKAGTHLCWGVFVYPPWVLTAAVDILSFSSKTTNIFTPPVATASPYVSWIRRKMGTAQKSLSLRGVSLEPTPLSTLKKLGASEVLVSVLPGFTSEDC